ncbi:glycosyl hydrolase [Flavobacterium nackdongense]|uniref:T9SS sorting signal type C domain-containing protein n=1 Tax=Flavobacterium nackdongense TaxID=2547394 RepID=A0A4P6YB45_9FLAO|nr:glycosyl hydrolase [Flavobacterium nackdongense]QBN20381.1 T9SS sorting signal type C domain-containing protein [Flavobacterium nackdongense]
MKKTRHFLTVFIFLIGLFANTAMGQNVNYFWGGGVNTSWTTAGNWSKTGRYIHTATFASGDTNVIIVTPNLQGAAPSTILAVGDAIVGPGIPVGTTVTAFSAVPAVGTTITLSQPTTAAGTASIIQTYLKSGNAPNNGTSPNTSTAVIDNAALSSPVVSTTGAVANVVLLRNNFGSISGPTLTIDNGGVLTVTSVSASPFSNAGGNIVNNGTLSITTTSTAASTGINCIVPTVPPTSGTNEYTYSGSGTLNVNLSASTTANSASINVTSLNAFTTYKFLFDGPTNFTLGTTATSYAIRTVGGTAMSPVIIGGAGFTLGSVSTPVRGGLLSVGNQSNFTINSGTTLEMNSATGNTTTGIVLGSNAVGIPTNFTNNGTINIFGESLGSGISAGVTTTANAQDIRINIVNGGTINVDLACVTPSVTNPTGFVWSGQAAYRQGQAGHSGSAGVFFTNNGSVTLRNRSTVALSGYAIWGSGAGQRMPTLFTNNSTGILNIDGSINSIPQGFTLTNNGTVNSNNSIAGFAGLTNNIGASINFGKAQAIFTVLATAAATVGSTYRDGNLNVYTIRTTKVNGTGLEILAETAPIATIPATGTLTFVSGSGDATIDYSAVSGINTTAISNNTTNSGTISTAQGGGFALNTISSATLTLDANSIIAPGGASGKGITDFARASNTLLGKLAIQVSGNTSAGIDYDQITNSGTNGGFDISAATLEITSLYTPSSSAVIPIVVASGTGTISGTFASVTGLTPGWTLSYVSPTAVNLVYTVITIPTIWTGAAADNNFFNEANWKDSVTNIVPAANTINPGANINLPLQINSAAATITSGAIQFGSGSLTISSADLTATSFSGGTVTLNDGAYVTLSSATPLLNNVQINLTSGIGWIKTPNYNARAVSDNNIGQIKVNNINAIYANNLRLDHYYLNGCVIRANLAATTPLTVYDSANLGGSSAAITVNTIHSGDAIANTMNNKMESFVLKKGFMVTIAIENDGTGKSKNFIASESDLVINVLPQTLQNAISFIRVMPWNWVTKKGFNAPVDDNLNASWRYQWNPNQATTIDHEFAPMAWGHTSANDPADITLLVDKYNSPYVMSFNEPDDCDGQSGQYGNLCQTDVAVGYHKNLMKTGMRIVSPGGREEAPFGWLKTFYDKVTAQDVRVDVIAVHWYDWGSNPTVNTNPTALQVFNRFKAYLTNVHNLYGLPIWITEFNANPARSQAINAGFLELALPYLESLDYIERYCWFPFNTGTHFTTGWDEVNRVPTNTIPSLVGTIYKNIDNTTPVNSSPSVPEPTLNQDNNLDLSNNPNVALNKPATSSSVYLTNIASNAVDGDTTSTDSRWLVEFATKPLPAWLEVDLQGSFTVDSFRIFEGANAVRNFEFQVWNPALNAGAGGWSTALAVTNNANTPAGTFRAITPVATTKVRLLITGHYDSGYIRMYELEVYGLKNNPTWTGGTSAAWTTATNWSTGIVPDQFSNVLIAGGATFQPTISTTTTINSLAIATGATLTVTAPNFTVKGTIDNEGTMNIANNSNLLQGEEFNPNTGNVNITKSSSALQRLDYTIWSSPVESQNLAAFSPETSLNRFYNYNETSNLYNAVANPSTTAFGLAGGTLIRMPNTHPTTPMVWNGTFTGIPNNGSINRVVTYKNVAPFGFGYNMIGNPYPSTLNALAFITANATKIESTLYFWRKTNGALGSAYATWNSSIGGTASGAGSEVPNGNIQVGQGFFVRAKPGTNPLATSFNQTLTFTNEMRLGNTSTQFFKTRQETKDRLWLNLTTTTGVFSQALIGYLNDATVGVDDFDGKYINDSPIALTSNINNEEYTIQSRPSFDPSDIVALNFKTDVAGEYTIALDHLDGVFANGQDVYLVDSKTGAEVDLKVASHTFTTASGVDNSRFSLKYQKTLKVDATAFNENSVRVYKNNRTIYVNSGAVAIYNVKVFDIQGRLIAEQNNLKANTATIKNLNTENQVLIVKITGENNSVVSKKVMF